MKDTEITITPSETVKQLVKTALVELGFDDSPFTIERPANTAHGDYATSVALSVFSQHKSNPDFTAKYSTPRALAEALTVQLRAATAQAHTIFRKIEVAGPGFINFLLTPEYLLSVAANLVSIQAKLATPLKSTGSVIIEYLGPNTNKPLHIGHLRNGALGLSLGRLLKEIGWTVHFATINNDRGLHIMKSVWGYLEFARISEDSEPKPWQELLGLWMEESELWLTPEKMTDDHLQKPDHFVGHWYKLADTYAENPDVQQAWAEMLQTWEDPQTLHHDQLRNLWQQMNDWFYVGYKETAATLGISFDSDYISYESQLYQAGKAIVLSGSNQGIFTQLSDGAIKVELEKYKLPDKILLRKDGTGIYMTFDLELTRQRSQTGVDKLVWVVGVDQQLYFQQLFAVAQMLGYGKKEDFYHFAYGMVRLPEGKMSSRKGRVVYADDLIELAKEQAAQVMAETNIAKSFSTAERQMVIEAVGVGAIKWTMLSQDPQSEITFNLQESVSFKGFAGPYIQYTAARCHSVLEKAENSTINKPFDILLNNLMSSISNIAEEEVVTLRNLINYFDIVYKSAQNYEPHTLATYLFELSQVFNTFYANCPILVTDEGAEQQTQRRLLITAAVEAVLKRGLHLLGISPVEKM